MVVEEMNILNTVFLRYDNEKIFYPNSVLVTKPISNFYRSPEMSDSVEFTVDVSTSVEQIGALKTKIKEYVESTFFTVILAGVLQQCLKDFLIIFVFLCTILHIYDFATFFQVPGK